MDRSTLPARQRHIPLAGTYNLRDLGGYATTDGQWTRWRTVYRADSLHRLDLEARATVIGYGVRTIIDLRRPSERHAAPNVLATDRRVRYHHLPLLGDVPAAIPVAIQLPQLYRLIVDHCQPTLAGVMATLAGPGSLPALVHCTAGKDRTGLVSALLLGLAGVPSATIAEDYALTATCLVDDYWREMRAQAEAGGRDCASYLPLLGCPPEAMLETLHYLDEQYGGIPAYLRQLGLSAVQLDALRRALAAPPGEEGQA